MEKNTSIRPNARFRSQKAALRFSTNLITITASSYLRPEIDRKPPLSSSYFLEPLAPSVCRLASRSGRLIGGSHAGKSPTDAHFRPALRVSLRVRRESAFFRVSSGNWNSVASVWFLSSRISRGRVVAKSNHGETRTKSDSG